MFSIKKISRSGNKLPILSSVFIVMLLCVSGAFVMVNDGDNSDATEPYTVTDGCLTINTDVTIDFTSESNLGTLYTFTTCIIESGLQYLGKYAFSGCTGLTSITFPDSLAYIGQYAFSGCTGLTSITIPDSATSIDINAFEGCTGLTSVTIPATVTEIRDSVFQGCTGLESITIPNSVTSIGAMAFSGCTGLKSIIISSSEISLESYIFENCTNLKNVYCLGSSGSIISGVDEVPEDCTISYDVVIVSVSFDIGSADVIVPSSQTIASGSRATTPDLTVSGYTVSWYSDPELTASFDFSMPITSATTIYLKLTAIEPETYTVTFDVGTSDVAVPASQTIVSGSRAADPALAVDSYTVKWYSDPTLTAEYDFASSITEDTTLYLGLTAVVVPVDPDPQTDEELTSDVDSMLIAGLILFIIGIITLVCMFAIGFPPINPIVIIVDLAVIAAGAILIFFGV